MAASPIFKVYDAEGNYQAACKEVEAACTLCGIYGKGSSIRINHRKQSTFFTEGTDGDASNSCDAATDPLQRFLDRNPTHA